MGWSKGWRLEQRFGGEPSDAFEADVLDIGVLERVVALGGSGIAIAMKVVGQWFGSAVVP